jgi:hypothetical protein
MVEKEVMITTDGRVLVKGEKGITEITDPDFLKYIRKGMTLTKVELDGPAEYTVDRAYDEATRRLGPLGPTGVPEEPSENTIEEISRMFKISCHPQRPQEGKTAPDNLGPKDDSVNHPKHYCSHPSGIECIAIARHYDFAIGNAIKYLWRHGLKTEEGKDDIDKSIEDLEKAIWYIKDEILTLENEKKDRQAKSN